MTSPTTASDAVHARATRKAFVRLVPLLMAAYFMAFVDRTNVGLAKSSLEVDAGIDAAAYGLGAGLFFLTYAAFEVPSNLILHRIGAKVWIGRIAVTWGLITMAMMFISSPAIFYVLRLLLGAAEAGLYPAPLVTELAPAPEFWPAEAEHQDYFARTPWSGYCRAVIAPKVAKFRKSFAHRLKERAA